MKSFIRRSFTEVHDTELGRKTFVLLNNLTSLNENNAAMEKLYKYRIFLYTYALKMSKLTDKHLFIYHVRILQIYCFQWKINLPAHLWTSIMHFTGYKVRYCSFRTFFALWYTFHIFRIIWKKLIYVWYTELNRVMPMHRHIFIHCHLPY